MAIPQIPLFKWPKRRLFTLAALLMVVLAAVTSLRFRYYGHWQGIYILRGADGRYLVKDDLLLGDENALLLALPAEPVFRFLNGNVSYATGGPRLEYEWFRRDGSGFVRSFAADGTEYLTCLSRYLDSGGKESQGLFVGGGLPFDLETDRRQSMNETGMAFFDGASWHHIWCNVNEAISPWSNPAAVMPPSAWKYRGSRILESTPRRLVLSSSHWFELDGVPVSMDRFMIFRAGTRYVTLVIRMTNIGTQPTGYFYVYGDEPWVGNYGSAEGNVGWVVDGLVPYEGTLDLKRYSWAGYVDHGNEAAGETHDRSGLANFIEWQGPVTPDTVYFSNRMGTFANVSDRVPLSHPQDRVIVLQWGPRLLVPGQSDTFVLSIGMADREPNTGFPLKPDTSFDLASFQQFLATQGF